MRSDNGCRGLCCICSNSPGCMYPKEPDRPVTQCEEFVCDGVPSLISTTHKPVQAVATEVLSANVC